MDDDKKGMKIFGAVIIILVVGVAGLVLLRGAGGGDIAPGKYDQFATCLKDKGLIFYGAFWCQHCQAQKKLFGSSAKLLPYIECSTPDTTGQTPICIEKNIKGYPTWALPDGSFIPNENAAGITLETLAAKSSCELPK